MLDADFREFRRHVRQSRPIDGIGKRSQAVIIDGDECVTRLVGEMISLSNS